MPADPGRDVDATHPTQGHAADARDDEQGHARVAAQRVGADLDVWHGRRDERERAHEVGPHAGDKDADRAAHRIADQVDGPARMRVEVGDHDAGLSTGRVVAVVCWARAAEARQIDRLDRELITQDAGEIGPVVGRSAESVDEQCWLGSWVAAWA